MNTISNNSVVEVNAVELTGKEHTANIENENIKNDVNSAIETTKISEQVEKSEKVDISAKQMEKVAQQLQDFVGKMNKGLEFSVDQDSGRDVIKVIDKNNGDLIKQYPTEEVLDLVSKLSDAAGSLINEEV